MIKFENRYVLDIDLPGYNVTIEDFIKLVIHESGFNIPIFELHISQRDYSMYGSLRESGTLMKIKYGPDQNRTTVITVAIMNYSYETNDDGRFRLVLTGMLDLKNFTNSTKIRSFKSTSSDALKKITSLKTDIQYTGSDEQVWIQHGNTDKDFCKRVIDHAYSKPDDLIIGCITMSGLMKVISVKTKFKESPKFTIRGYGDSNSSDLQADNIKVESDAAYWTNTLSEGRCQPMIHVADRSSSTILPSMMSVVDGSSNSSRNTNMNYPTQIDNGNCHKSYYKAEIDNTSLHVMLMKNNLYVDINCDYIDPEKLSVLDLISFKSINPNQMSKQDPLMGKYIITEKTTMISKSSKFSQTLRLNRDYIM